MATDDKPIVETAIVRADDDRGHQILMSTENRETIQAMAYDIFASGKGFLPDHIKSEEQARITMYYGYEIGLPPMASLMEVYLVHGRPGLQSKAMLALLDARPDLGYYLWGECNEREANLTMFKHTPDQGYVAQPFRYTMEDARQAGIAGQMYQKYPRPMLRSRCASEAVRVTFPGLLLGCAYTPEELGAPMVEVEGEVQVDQRALAAGEVRDLDSESGADYRALKAAGLVPAEGEVDFEASGGAGAPLDMTPDPDEVAREEIGTVVAELVPTLLPPEEAPQWAIEADPETRAQAAKLMGQMGLSTPHLKAIGDLAIAEGHTSGRDIWLTVSQWWTDGLLPARLYDALLDAADVARPEANPFETAPEADWAQDGEEQ